MHYARYFDSLVLIILYELYYVYRSLYYYKNLVFLATACSMGSFQRVLTVFFFIKDLSDFHYIIWMHLMDRILNNIRNDDTN